MRVSTFLMFEGNAVPAIELYQTAFPGTKVGEFTWYPQQDEAAPKKLMPTEVHIAGHRLMFTDSPAPHAFTFTPSISLFIDCPSRQSLVLAHDTLIDGGEALMPLGNYGFSKEFAWVKDRFGVTWQLNLP